MKGRISIKEKEPTQGTEAPKYRNKMTYYIFNPKKLTYITYLLRNKMPFCNYHHFVLQ